VTITNEAQAKTSTLDRIRNYFREVRTELRKVVWPTREDTLNLTGVVLLVTLAMTLFLGGLDSILNWALALVRDLIANLA
jgi:preprotein translocase SecE subunit